MATMEKHLQTITQIKAELQSMKEENAALKRKLGIRQFLTTPPPPLSSSSAPMDTQNGDTAGTPANQPSALLTEKKPPPFFINGVKSIKVFKSVLSRDNIKPQEMKALGNGELKIILNSSDDYRKLRNTLNDITSLSEKDKKEIGQIKYHTYRLHEEKPYTVFVRGLYYTADLNDISSELSTAGHQVMNVINIHIKKKLDNKTSRVKLPLFKVDLKVADNNRAIFDIHTLCDCAVSIELPKKTANVPQCTRCQDIGHTKNYCSKTPKCVKCGDRHEFRECQSPKTAPPKCANCKGAHTAN